MRTKSLLKRSDGTRGKAIKASNIIHCRIRFDTMCLPNKLAPARSEKKSPKWKIDKGMLGSESESEEEVSRSRFYISNLISYSTMHSGVLVNSNNPRSNIYVCSAHMKIKYFTMNRAATHFSFSQGFLRSFALCLSFHRGENQIRIAFAQRCQLSRARGGVWR